MNDKQKNQFEDAGNRPAPSLLTELFDLLRHNKKYWLLPIVLCLLGLGLIVLFGGTAAAPFIYTLF